MGNRVTRYFPSYDRIPVPAVSGNGKHGPSANGTKGITLGPGVIQSDTLAFVPVDSSSHTLSLLTSSERAMIASVLCYAAISYRMRKVSEAPLMVVEETDDSDEGIWLPKHPLAELLEQPNADQEMADLMEESQLYADLDDGMVLWVKDEDRAGRPGRLSAFSAREFTVHPEGGRLYGKFKLISTDGRVRKELDPEEVVFLRYPHPTDRWRGLSPTDVVLSRIGIEGELLQATKSAIRNAVVPSLVVTYGPDTPLTDDQRTEYKASMQAGHASALNQGKPFVTEGGATVTQMKLGFAGLEGGELYREIEAAVCIAYGVRPEILGMMIGLENAPWSHMQIAQRLSYDETIIPLWSRWERVLTRQLLRPVDPDRTHLIRFDKSRIRALESDRERDARISRLVSDIATPNQRRQIAGLDPMEEDLEFWDGKPQPKVVAAPAPTSAPPAPEKRAPRPEQKAASDMATLAVNDALLDTQASAWEYAALIQLAEDREKVLAIAAEVKPTRKDDPPPYEPAGDEWVAEFIRRATDYLRKEAPGAWRTRVAGLLRNTATVGVQRAAAEVGVSFDLLQPGLLAYVEKRISWLAREVNNTTLEGLEGVLRAGLAEGESVAALTKRIQEATQFSRERATLIARTEATANTNGAAVDSLRDYAAESGDKFTKRWLATLDARTRDEHEAMNGETVAIDADFSNGLSAPGEPNCRCTLVYAMED